MIQLVGKQEGQNSQMKKGKLAKEIRPEGPPGPLWMPRISVTIHLVDEAESGVPTIHHISPLYQRKYKVNVINSRHPRVIEIPETASLEELIGNQVFLFLLKVYSPLEIAWPAFFMVAKAAGGGGGGF